MYDRLADSDKPRVEVVLGVRSQAPEGDEKWFCALHPEPAQRSCGASQVSCAHQDLPNAFSGMCMLARALP